MALNEKGKNLDFEDEPYGLGCALEMFKESDEILSMIDNFKNIYMDNSLAEKAYEKFHFIIGQYKEQPHLIDSKIDQLLERALTIIKDKKSTEELKHFTFKHLYIIANVRSYKIFVRHLPHEVSDFEFVLQMLEAQNPTDANTWTTRYILLLWMSIIIMIPFNLNRFDNSNERQLRTSMERIFEIIKTYVVVGDKCEDAASYLSAFVITRNDVKQIYMSEYIEWAIMKSSKDESIFTKKGILSSLSMILKHGKREDLLLFVHPILERIVNDDFKSYNATTIQKLICKIVQRIGLVFLPPRIISWRYTRGSRLLSNNLSDGDNTKKIPICDNIQLYDDDFYIPDEIEEIIDQLIQGICHSDNVVRWSAAKGIGRVTGRLPQDFADEVVLSLLDLFNPRQTDAAWHGGCLALAELGRRGLLLPERLPEVIPLIQKALIYDEPKGYSSVGSHIRDAACYVCWSFARAYGADIIKPYVHEISTALLIVACFDREINCRRAASAAFQENVGRQGIFPHGIEILTIADFFGVSIRSNAYLNISVFIAQFDEYKYAIINHLVDKKINHWDISIRELAAQAFHNLTPQAPEYMAEKVLPILFNKTNSIDLNCRHGAILGIGEIIYALSKLKKIDEIVESDIIEKVENLIPTFQDKMYFRGMGGELLRQSCCEFIEKCSLANFNFSKTNIANDWLHLINECIPYNVPKVKEVSIKALTVLLNQYYNSNDLIKKQNEIVDNYVHELLLTISQENRMGYALALGALPKFILLHRLDYIINALVESTFINPTTIKWAESRRDTIKALASISNTLIDEIGFGFNEEHILKIYHVFFEGLKDYTQDKRGDVGAWVREASVLGLQTITLNIALKSPILLKQELVSNIISGIAQQAVEKIDRTRAIAGKVFYNFFYNDILVPNIPYFMEIKEILPDKIENDINWNSAAHTFPIFVKLIEYPPYTYNVLLGLITSIGGLTETLIKYSSSTFFAFIKDYNKDELEKLIDIIYGIFKNYQKNDRIVVPMLRFLNKLMGCDEVILIMQESQVSKNFFDLIKSELSNCKDLHKLIDGINLLTQFIQIKNICCSALTQLCIYLCYRQPYIRRITSSELYETLLLLEGDINVNCENMDNVMQILSNTNWEGNLDDIRLARNEMCKLMGIRAPVPKQTKT